ncbi:MAG: hypothetical protein GDA46_04745 [Bdellovibrionales bacterium]|nr:hypothetical protein [Bdellovibrionales bacterium]
MINLLSHEDSIVVLKTLETIKQLGLKDAPELEPALINLLSDSKIHPDVKEIASKIRNSLD